MWSRLTPLPPLTTLTDEGYERDALPTPKWTLTSTVDEDTDPIRASYILPSLPAYDEDDFREGLKSPLRPIKTGFEDSRDGKEEFDPISLALPYVGYLPPHVRYGVDIGESRGLKESGGLVGRNQAEGVVQDQGKVVGMGRDTSVSDRAGEDPWLLAGETVCDTRPEVLSWDNLRHPTRKFGPNEQTRGPRGYSSPFLSEATEAVWEAAMHKLISSSSSLSQSFSKQSSPSSSLLESLLTTSLGSVSRHFIWDVPSQSFVWDKGEELRIWGKSSEASSSVMVRFLEMGTRMRRLEGVVDRLEGKLASKAQDQRSTKSPKRSRQPSTEVPGRAAVALAHSFGVLLSYLREQVAKAGSNLLSANAGILESWHHLDQISHIISSISSFGFCSEIDQTPQLERIPIETSGLLTHLYGHLVEHVEHGSSILVQGFFAYLLESTSKHWIETWEMWVGMRRGGEGGRGVYGEMSDLWLREIGIERVGKNGHAGGLERTGGLGMGSGDDVLPGSTDRNSEAHEYIFDPSLCPSFLPPTMARELFEAGRSLRLLGHAKPDHPLCRTSNEEDGDGNVEDGSRPRWRWHEEEIGSVHEHIHREIDKQRRRIRLWRTKSLQKGGNQAPSQPSSSVMTDRFEGTPEYHFSGVEVGGAMKYPPELRDLFSTFDALPGTLPSFPIPGSTMATLSGSILSKTATTYQDQQLLVRRLHQLIRNDLSHPDQANRTSILPPSSPTISVLAWQSIQLPLISYARLANSSLLSLFFRDLALQEHVSLLRRFLLLGDDDFTRRLTSALFAEVGDGHTDLSRDRRSRKTSEREGEANWGAGLGIHLNDRTVWPPGGAELSIALRTVLLDSIAEMRQDFDRRLSKVADETVKEAEATAWRDLESRVSFAIRDLDEDDESGSWLDPQAIEALDFLYLDFKPPPTLSVLITPNILEKYGRIFNYLLRLQRLKAVTRGLYDDVFKTNTVSSFISSDQIRILRALIFEVHHAIRALSSFATDVAIESNWASFTEGLGRMRAYADSSERGDDRSDLSERGFDNLDTLLSFHSLKLDSVLHALLLQKKQAPLMKIIDDGIFSTVLYLGRFVKDITKGSVEGGDMGVLEKARTRFRSSVALLAKVLQGLEETGGSRLKKPSALANHGTSLASASNPFHRDRDPSLDRGPSILTGLLVRLDWGGFYRNSESVTGGSLAVS